MSLSLSLSLSFSQLSIRRNGQERPKTQQHTGRLLPTDTEKNKIKTQQLNSSRSEAGNHTNTTQRTSTPT
jgi:hypothetical protein